MATPAFCGRTAFSVPGARTRVLIGAQWDNAVRLGRRYVRSAAKKESPASSSASNTKAPRSAAAPWQRKTETGTNINRKLNTFLIALRNNQGRLRKRINQYSLLENHSTVLFSFSASCEAIVARVFRACDFSVGSNDIGSALDVMNVFYNQGIPFSDQRVTSVLLNLCLFYQWIPQAKQVVQLYSAWLRKPPLQGDLLDALCQFARQGDTATCLRLLRSGRDDWQMLLTPGFYDLAIMRTLRGRKRQLVLPPHREAETADVDSEKDLFRTHVPQEPSAWPYCPKVGSLVGTEKHLVISLLLYYDSVQLGLTLSWEIHQALLDRIMTEVRRRRFRLDAVLRKAAHGKLIFAENDLALLARRVFLARLAVPITGARHRASPWRHAATLRLLSYGVFVHERIFVNHPYHLTQVSSGLREMRFPQLLLKTLQTFYKLLSAIPEPLRRLGSAKYQIPHVVSGGSTGWFGADIVTEKGLANALEWVKAELQCC